MDYFQACEEARDFLEEFTEKETEASSIRRFDVDAIAAASGDYDKPDGTRAEPDFQWALVFALLSIRQQLELQNDSLRELAIAVAEAVS